MKRSKVNEVYVLAKPAEHVLYYPVSVLHLCKKIASPKFNILTLA